MLTASIPISLQHCIGIIHTFLLCNQSHLHPHHKQSNDNFYPPSCLDVCHHGMDSRQHHFCGYEVHNFLPPVLWLAALLLLKIYSNHKFLLSCGESLCYNKFVVDRKAFSFLFCNVPVTSRGIFL